MTVSFADKDTRLFYEGRDVRRFRGFAAQAARRMQILTDATSLDDLRPLRSNRLEALQGDRSGQFSVRINDQWRICFTFSNGEARDVQIVDYH
ncbi:MAG: type II toxin-antitoxin system RelE/ParE family toxin [Rhodospirillaceae bacterium]|nr:MAG: type II toxin-antitoxin system RelE/ParE family toxin [Rhodospirillaceae bacterium]